MCSLAGEDVMIRIVGFGLSVLMIVLASQAAVPEPAARIGAGAGSADLPTALPGTLPEGAARRSSQFSYLGVGSCSAEACHGGKTDPGQAGSECLTWLKNDPHAGALNVLTSDRSKEILANFRGGSKLGGAHGNPEQELLCLKCHVAFELDHHEVRDSFSKEDGVSCESCHGPASGWIAQHTLGGWRNLPDAEKSRWGMRPLKGLAIRAEVCADCHVGSPDAEVDHDLIAAGHPLLRFEFGSYHDQTPKHWNHFAERVNNRLFETDAWREGQIASMRRALAMVASRAGRVSTDPAHPVAWPDFALSECSACHRSLAESDLSKLSRARTGEARWGDWFFSTLPMFSAGSPDPAVAKFEAEVQALQALMGQTLPNKVKAAKALSDAAGSLGTIEVSLRSSKITPRRLPEGVDLSRWEIASQWYLAQAAWEQSQIDRGWPSTPEALDIIRRRLALVRDLLRFNSGTTTPRPLESLQIQDGLLLKRQPSSPE